MEQSENIILSVENSSEEIGTGLRLAFSRCR
nr:contact-dependent growth inhibition system immunity protein [Pantoea sp. 201603H]